MTRHVLITVSLTLSIFAILLFANAYSFAIDAHVKQSEITLSGNSPNSETESQSKHFAGPKIIGVKAKIDLKDAEQQIKQTWQQLLANKVLISNVNWRSGKVRVYAYFSEFDSNFSAATMVLGFHHEDTLLKSQSASFQLPSGSTQAFKIDLKLGTAENSAWAKGFAHNNLIERYVLDQNGDTVHGDAIVIVKGDDE